MGIFRALSLLNRAYVRSVWGSQARLAAVRRSAARKAHELGVIHTGKRVALEKKQKIAINTRLKQRLPSRLTEVEDLRRFHPLGPYRPAKKVDGTNARVVAFTGRRTKKGIAKRVLGRLPAGIAYRDAISVITCIRRKMRKQVLHANKVAGSPANRFRMPVRTYRSDIIC